MTASVGVTPAVLAYDDSRAEVCCANVGSNTLTVLDAATGIPSDSAVVGIEPWSLVIAEDAGHVFVGNRAENTLTYIQQSGYIVLDTIKMSCQPNRLLSNGTAPGSTRPATTPTTSTSSMRCRTRSSRSSSPSTARAQWRTTPRPAGSLLAAFLADDVKVINAVTNNIVRTLDVGDGPNSLCWNPATNKLYCTNYTDRTVTIVDAAVDTVNRTIA